MGPSCAHSPFILFDLTRMAFNSRFPFTRSCGATLFVALVLAGCSSPPPAPIVSRTVPQPVTPRPAPAPVVQAQPRPLTPATPAAIMPAAPAAQAAPVRDATLESRPIELKPLPDSRTPSSPSAASVPAQPPASASLVRTEPRGSKVPYSDTALTDMRSAESTASPSATVPVAPRATEPAKPAELSAPPEWGWPASGRVIQSFSESSKGIALGGSAGDPVVAAADGKVIFSGNGPRGYGNLVIVKHSNDLLSVYAHNRSLAVKEGQSVKRGQKLAELGETGGTTPRLHFEIRQQGKPVDPAAFLPKR